MVLWLLLGLLLAPTLFAVLSRLIARRGSTRSAALVAVAGFAGCIACVLVLRWLPLGTESLGPLQLLVPSTDIVVAGESFLDLQPDTTAGTRENASGQVSNAGELGPSATALPKPTAVPEPAATPEPTATAQPTSLPEPTPEPTSLPAPTLEPTAETEPTDEPEPAARAEPERYVVEPGDTLRGIAALYQVESAELQRYNGLSDEEADSLQIGQVLFIPPN